MRVFAAAGYAELRQFAEESSVRLHTVVPDSDDEADEFAALERAGQQGPVVVAADVADSSAPIALSDVAAWHADADGSSDLAWYATQELDQVLALFT